MTTLREAATQALEALENLGMRYFEKTEEVLHKDVYESLKAALVEDAMQKFTEVSQEIEAALGCDHCNHPLYAAVKCRVCGRETPIIEPKISLGEDVLECPNCASLEAQNTELDRKLAEMERKLFELQAAVFRSQGIRCSDVGT